MSKKMLYIIPFAFLFNTCSKKNDTHPSQNLVSPNSTSATSSTSTTSSTASNSSSSSSSTFIPNNYKGFLLLGTDSFPLIAAVCEVSPANAPYYRMVSYTCDTCADFIELIIKIKGFPPNDDYYVSSYSSTNVNFKGRITCGFNGNVFNSLTSGVIHFSNNQGTTSALFENITLMKDYDQTNTTIASGILICE